MSLFLLGILAMGFWAKDGVQNMPDLMSALAREEWALAQELVDQGADVNEPGPMGATTMLFAMRHKNLGAVKMLVDAGFDLETPIMGKDILEFAREMGDAEVYAYLESILVVEILPM